MGRYRPRQATGFTARDEAIAIGKYAGRFGSATSSGESLPRSIADEDRRATCCRRAAAQGFAGLSPQEAVVLTLIERRMKHGARASARPPDASERQANRLVRALQSGRGADDDRRRFGRATYEVKRGTGSTSTSRRLASLGAFRMPWPARTARCFCAAKVYKVESPSGDMRTRSGAAFYGR